MHKALLFSGFLCIIISKAYAGQSSDNNDNKNINQSNPYFFRSTSVVQYRKADAPSQVPVSPPTPGPGLNNYQNSSSAMPSAPSPSQPDFPKNDGIAAWYRCDSSQCALPNCKCANASSPLPIQDTPQFILISNDDMVHNYSASNIDALRAGKQQAGGCPLPATWFVRSIMSACLYVRELFNRGDEMAAHAVKHIDLTPSTSTDVMRSEILGSKDWLMQTCTIPIVSGYRSPYRDGNPKVRRLLADHGFLYDSTINFMNATMDDRPWPFTMNYGLPDPSCQHCNPGESYKPLWEVPLWSLWYDGQRYPMDPGAARTNETILRTAPAEERDPGAVLKYAFDQAYNSNKAPIPIAVHEYWFNATRLDSTRNFIDYALSHPHVYFVRYRDLVQWMQAPVPNSEMDGWITQRCGKRRRQASGSGKNKRKQVHRRI